MPDNAQPSLEKPVGIGPTETLHNVEGVFVHAWGELEVELVRIRDRTAGHGVSQSPD